MAVGFAVGTEFRANDAGIIKLLRKMERGTKKFGTAADKSFNKASRSAKNFQSITKSILKASVIQKGFGLLQQGIASVAREFVSYDDAITSASAKFKGLDLTTKKGQQTLLQLKKTARGVGRDTKFAATEAAQGLDFYATAGFTAAQAMAVLKPTAKLATIANLDLARTSDIASDSLGAFGLAVKDPEQLQKNFINLSNVMATTLTQTNTSMEDMFEAIKKGAPAFVTAGQSMASFNALMGVMANSGIKGSEAGTILRNTVLRLGDPVSKAAKLLKGMGVEVEDSAGNFRDILDIMQDFEKGLESVGSVQKIAALGAVFGTRAVSGLSVQLKEGTTSIAAFRKELENSAGATDRMSAIMEKSLGNRLKAMSSAANDLGIELFSAFQVRGENAIEKFTEALRTMDMKPIINTVHVAIEAFKILFAVLSPLVPLMPSLVAGFVAYNIALKLSAMAPAIAFGLKFARVFLLMAKAKGIATAAQWAFNFAVAANPIGLIIAAVAALIVGLIALQKHFDIIGKVKAVFGFGEAAKNKKPAPGFTEERQQGLGLNLAPVAPNKELAEARASAFNFNGQLNIAGAPPGSTFEDKSTGAPAIDVNLLGAAQ